MGCAVSEVITHQGSGNGPERLLHRRHLCENVCAIAILFNHAMKAANLTFDTSQTSQIRRFNVSVNANRFTPRLTYFADGIVIGDATSEIALFRSHIFYSILSRRNRKLFMTTLKELRAIAALATTGLSNKPKTGYSTPAASGIPITL
jgi:hypothetical protein